jgi:hypothetical protein
MMRARKIIYVGLALMGVGLFLASFLGELILSLVAFVRGTHDGKG